MLETSAIYLLTLAIQLLSTPVVYKCINLFSFSADINAKDNFKWSALHHACHSGQVDLVQFLLDRGAEIDAQTINGGTPLMRAIESSREAVVELLISKGLVEAIFFRWFYFSIKAYALVLYELYSLRFTHFESFFSFWHKVVFCTLFEVSE